MATCSGRADSLKTFQGTAVWAVEYAEERPESQVFGSDLSLIQPLYVPPNCQFVREDSEEEWVFPFSFDYIHLRLMYVLEAKVKEMLLIALGLHASRITRGWFRRFSTTSGQEGGWSTRCVFSLSSHPWRSETEREDYRSLLSTPLRQIVIPKTSCVMITLPMEDGWI